MEVTPLPDGAITTTDIFDDKIGITISQLWQDEAGIAIEAGMDSCIITGNIGRGATEEVDATCVDGFTGATVVVYFDKDFNPEQCNACDVDELALLGDGNSTFCAYRIEIPCSTNEVECAPPSAAPSGSYYPSAPPSEAPTNSANPSAPPTGSPTAAPTDTPTVSPTSAPTSSPTVSPTTSPTVSTLSPTEKAPTDAPTAACPLSDAILVANEGETLYPELPITITFQNTTHVGFKVENTFASSSSSVFTQYHSGSFGETECLSEENVENVLETDFMARCMRNTKISIVNVWMTDCKTTNTFLELVDNAEIPECCHPGEECKTVQYTFKLPCINPCPPEEGGAAVAEEAPKEEESQQRRLFTKKIQERKSEEGSTAEFEDIMGHPEENGSNDNFCVVEDYPCGTFDDKVHVCHYSARDGYKTFCVPEADSDALRFYPKDYCGPCVGGYASS